MQYQLNKMMLFLLCSNKFGQLCFHTGGTRRFFQMCWGYSKIFTEYVRGTRLKKGLRTTAVEHEKNLKNEWLVISVRCSYAKLWRFKELAKDFFIVLKKNVCHVIRASSSSKNIIKSLQFAPVRS